MAARMKLSPQRRRLLRALAAAPLALTLPAAAQAVARQRLLVLVYLHGGNDGYNTWVPYTDARYYSFRPTIAVPRDAVIRITDRHGFHPSLAPLVPSWEARDLAIVQGIGYPGVTQQHYRDTEIAFTAEDRDILAQGWAARALARRARPGGLADAMALGLLDIREADPMGPFRGNRVGVVQVHHVTELLAKRRVAECVLETNERGREMARRATREIAPQRLRTRFPEDPMGLAMRAVVDLAIADPLLPAVHVTLNGLDGDKHHSVDCHWKQLDYHGEALGRLAAALAALRSAMIELGRWDDTLVATYDEFGRSPVENEDRGTHHGAATTHFVMGGRVKGGLLGEAPPIVDVHWIGGPPPVIDTRQLWTTVVQQWWETDPSGLFSGQPRPLDLLRA
jgi:uncharacterized protein (DUF1501 family)